MAQTVVTVTSADVELAKVSVKLARLEGREPDPRVVRIATAKHSATPSSPA